MTATALGVCGFPRCGSTMLMRMLDSAGIAPVDGSASGSYELPWVGLEELATCDLRGRAVKLLDGPMRGMVPVRADGWKFILLRRSATEQAKSMVKFMSALIPDMPLEPDAADVLACSFRDDWPKMLKALGEHGPVLLLEFEEVLADPLREAREIAAFLRPEFDVDENFAFFAASVVLKRDPRCRPDLAIELAIMEDSHQ